jgi:hypothetical protein
MGSKLKIKIKTFIKKKLYFFFKPKIHVIADSHGVALQEINFEKEFNIKAEYCIVPGATASGLSNPNSKTKAFPKFKEYINKNVKKNDITIIQLGEVDCGFTIWLRAQKNELPLEAMLQEAFVNYTTFIRNVILKNCRKIIIASAILPTIDDKARFGIVANLRSEIKANQIERTELTMSFNKMIVNWTLDKDIIYLNLEKYLFNSETKVIKSNFLNTDKTDHHPEPTEISKIYLAELKKYIT